MSESLFDKILAGDLPADKVYEDEFVLAFRDISPQAPVHVLVIPKKKWTGISEVADATPEEAGRFFIRVPLVARKLGLDEKGYRVVFNQGKDGLQTVPYIHAHILGGKSLTWPPG